MTCEIMQLDKGYLYVRLANGEGTISVDWTKVVRIESQYHFIVTNEKGQRFISNLQNVADAASPDKFLVEVTGSSTTNFIPSSQVVVLQQNDVGFWANLHGSIDSGLNYTKQQNRVQYNFDFKRRFIRNQSGRWVPIWVPISAGVDLTRIFALIFKRELHDNSSLLETFTWDWWAFNTMASRTWISAQRLAAPLGTIFR